MVEASSSGKLIYAYWNLRGGPRGNPGRYLLAYCGAQWEEKMYICGSGEWQKEKDTLFPFSNLPYIIDGEYKLSETYAVHNYIAQKFMPSMIGSTP